MRIGLFCTDATDVYQRSLVAVLSQIGKTRGHELTVLSTHVYSESAERASPENRLLSLLVPGVFDGVVLLADSIFHRASASTAQLLLADLKETPWISVDRTFIEGPCVHMDHTQALPSLMNHLFQDHGYRDYLLLLGPRSSLDARERTQFLESYLSSRGEGVRWVSLVCDFIEERAYEAVVSFFKSQPTVRPRVIVAANDTMAMGALRALRTLGLRCPQDCAVTGFDDVDEAAFEDPPLTTVRQPMTEIAQEAIAYLDDPASRSGLMPMAIASQLVIRESCGCRGSGSDSPDRSAWARLQSLRIRGETLLGASATLGVQLNGSLDLDNVLGNLQQFCRTLDFPGLRVVVVDDDELPPQGLASRWREVFRFDAEKGGQRPERDTDVFELLSVPLNGPALVQTVSLLYAEGRVLGILTCQIPLGWLGYQRLLSSNLASGLSRLRRWKSLLEHAEDLEVSVVQRTHDLTAAIRALQSENQRRKDLEATLEAERLALGQILDAQPIALVVLSKTGRRVRYFNRQFARLTGWDDKGSPPPPDAFSAQYGDVLAGGKSQELALPIRDGTTVPVILGRTEISVRGEPSVLAVMMDLTLQKQLERDLLDVRENASRRFGQELHDDVCQKLAALALFTKILDQKLVQRTGQAQPEVAELSSLTKGILDHVRALSRGLFPIEVGLLPLSTLVGRLLREVASQTGLVFDWNSDEDETAGSGAEAELHLFRILQEAIHNTLKHAQAHRVTLRLERRNGEILLEYRDDGKGPSSSSHAGLGLRSMAYRASQLKATFSWGAVEPQGFWLKVSTR